MWEREEKIRIAEQIVSKAQDAIIMADREGIIRLWNKGAEIIFGYSPAEAMGQSLRILVPENLQERHERGYREVMQSGRSRYARELLAVPALRKDGARISVEFTIILILDQQEHIMGAAAILRDVSARWEKERARESRLADSEARLKG